MSVQEPNQPLLQTPLVRIGKFRCPIDHPQFQDSGPTRSHLFVFPRTSVWIEQDGRRPFVADSTHAVLYNPRHHYRRRAISPDGDRSDYFGVSVELHRDIQAAFEPATGGRLESGFRDAQVAADAHTYRMQRRVFEHVQRASPVDAMAVEEAVIAILHRLLASVYQERRPMTTAKQHADLAEDARAFLAAHFASRHTLQDVARALDCSVFHLCRVFRRVTGMTLHAYRQQLRVRHALEPITAGNCDLLGIALGLGYSGHSHFTAAFRDAFGAPPSVVRAEPNTLTS